MMKLWKYRICSDRTVEEVKECLVIGINPEIGMFRIDIGKYKISLPIRLIYFHLLIDSLTNYPHHFYSLKRLNESQIEKLKPINWVKKK